MQMRGQDLPPMQMRGGLTLVDKQRTNEIQGRTVIQTVLLTRESCITVKTMLKRGLVLTETHASRWPFSDKVFSITNT